MAKKLMLMLPMLHQGGFERVAVATARLLQEDYDVSLCIFSDRNIHYDVSGLNVINLDVPSEKSKLRKVWNVLKRIRRAKRIKAEMGIDITYSFGNTANRVNIYSRAGDRVVTGFRCGTDLEVPGLVRQCIRRSDLVISCSEEIRELLERDFSCGTSGVVYNPLDIRDVTEKAAERTVEREPGTFVIATMGRDDLIKAHWHMIKAFALVAEKHPEARLWIIGAGKYTAYRELAEQLGVLDRITFTGALKNPFPEVAAADLYVLPSNREGFPNALVEAMALRRPVIATDCRTGPREILLNREQQQNIAPEAPSGVSVKKTIRGEYGIMIPDMSAVLDTDPAHREEGERILADEIIRFIEDPEDRAAYGERAAKRAEDFSPEAYRQRLIQVLEEK